MPVSIDMLMTVHSLDELQDVLIFDSTFKYLGLEINKKRTKILVVSNTPPNRSFSNNGVDLEAVYQFSQLGTTVSSFLELDSQSQRRILAATTAVYRLSRRVFKNYSKYKKVKRA